MYAIILLFIVEMVPYGVPLQDIPLFDSYAECALFKRAFGKETYNYPYKSFTADDVHQVECYDTNNMPPSPPSHILKKIAYPNMDY
jgi:hypothetical protein